MQPRINLMGIPDLAELMSASNAILTRYPAATLVRFTLVITENCQTYKIRPTLLGSKMLIT